MRMRADLRDATASGGACVHAVASARSSSPLCLDRRHVGSMCGPGASHDGVVTALAGLGLASSRVRGARDCRRALLSLAHGDELLVRTGSGMDARWGKVDADRDGHLHVEGEGTVRAPLPLDLGLRLLREGGLDAVSVPGGQAPRRVEVGPLLPADGGTAAVGRAVRLCEAEFGFHEADMGTYLDGVVDWHASRAVRVDGEVAGVYLLNAASLHLQGFPDAVFEALSAGRQVEGVALVTDPAHRGAGYGRLLRDEPARLGFDLVWGYALKALDNLERWRMHRDVVHETEDSFVTAAALDGPAGEYLPDPEADGPMP